jgi:NAD(P)H-nitrite reductase large subunit
MKAILCPCEDITVREVADAIEDGYDTVEDIKRYTGLATGSCQGKLCLEPCIALLAERTGKLPQELGLIRFRAPVEPIPLGLLAAGDRSTKPKEGLHD